jgi:hypothetical protein
MTHFRTAKNVRFIWHGEWADPELEFNGYIAIADDVEDFITTCMEDEGFNPLDNDLRNKWIEKHQDEVEQMVIDLSY